MEIAHIGSPWFTHKYCRGTYHMVISPWLLLYPVYTTFYRNAHRPEGTHVIMDNGTFEKSRIATEVYMTLIGDIRPDFVVLPDVLIDPKQTLEDSRNAVLAFADAELDVQCVAFVPQAVDETTLMRVTETWLKWWNRSDVSTLYNLMLAVPSPRMEFVSHSQWKDVYLRSEVIDKLHGFGYPIHLLGVPDPQDFIHKEMRNPRAAYADTSLAYAVGSLGNYITPETTKMPLSTTRRISPVELATARVNRRILDYWTTAEPSWEYPVSVLFPDLDRIPGVGDFPMLGGWYDFLDLNGNITFTYSKQRPDRALGQLIHYTTLGV